MSAILQRIESIRTSHHREFMPKMLRSMMFLLAGPVLFGIYLGHSWFGHLDTTANIIYVCFGTVLTILFFGAFQKIFEIGNQDDRTWVLKCTRLADNTDELDEVGIDWDHIEKLVECEIDRAFNGYERETAIQAYTLERLYDRILQCQSMGDLNQVLHWDRTRGIQIDHIEEIVGCQHRRKPTA